MIRNAVTKWMWDKGLSHGDIVIATGASKASVSMTIKGDRDDPRVLDFLRKKGCSDLIIENRRPTLVSNAN